MDNSKGIPLKRLLRVSFVSYAVGEFISCAGSSMSSFVLIWWILKQGSVLNLAGFVTVQAVTQIFASIVIGGLIERYNKKRLMIFCDVANFFILLFFAYIMGMNRLTIPIFYLVGVIGSVIDVTFKIAASVFGYKIVEESLFQKSNSLRTFLRGLATIIGPAVAGFLLSYFAFWVIFLIDALSYLASAIMTTTIRFREIIDPALKKKKADLKAAIGEFGKEMADGYGFMFRSGLLLLFVVLALKTIIAIPFFIYLPQFVMTVLHKTAAAYGSLESALALGALVLSLVLIFVSIKNRERRLFQFSILFEALFFGAFAFIKGFYWALGAAFLYGAIGSLSGLITGQFIRSSVPSNMLGRVNSIFTIVSSLQPIGFMIAGIFMKFFSVDKLFFALACMGIVNFVLALLTKNFAVKKTEPVAPAENIALNTTEETV